MGSGGRVVCTTRTCTGASQSWLPVLQVCYPSPPDTVVVPILRLIFLGLITCLSGSSYVFIIAIIVLLKRQSHKPQQVNAPPSKTAVVEVELKAAAVDGQSQLSVGRTPRMHHSPSIWTTMVKDTDGALEEQRRGRLTTVQLCPPPRGGGLDMDRLNREEEEEEKEEDRISNKTNAQSGRDEDDVNQTVKKTEQHKDRENREN